MNEIARKIREGDARVLARLATGIENRDAQALATLRELEQFAGHARIVGITGPPGAGKSTLVDALALELRRRGKTLAILAVDPSSRSTGGAILGDRIRMQQHHADAGIFIRSMATRGTLGGMARATADLARLMDAAGKDYVIIETVGVGQGEIEIASVAQVTVVVLVPGMGDDVQALKAGIMEIAGIFAINKSDRPGAERVEMELHAEGFTCPVIRTVATQGTGIAELVDAIALATPTRRCDDAPMGLRPTNNDEGHSHPRRDGRGSDGGDEDTPTFNGAVARDTLPDGLGSDGGASIDHLGIAVQSLENSIPFYESLGLAVAHRGSVPTEKVDVAMIPVGQSRIELLQPSSPDSPIAKFLEKRGPGLHHVALRVPDLNAAVARLAAGGARLLNQPGGHVYVFVHPASTGGVLLELIQEGAT